MSRVLRNLLLPSPNLPLPLGEGRRARAVPSAHPDLSQGERVCIGSVWIVRCLATAGFLLVAASANAEGQFAAGDAAALAEAPHFLAATGKPALVAAFVEQLRLAGMAMLARGGLSFADRAELTDKLLMPELRAAAPNLLAQWATIYGNDLSAEDMKAIEAFYATPAGQHLLASQPQIETSLQIASLTWQTATLRDAINKNLDALRARGYQE